MTLTKHVIFSSLPPAAGNLKDEVFDVLVDEVSEAIEMGLEAVLTSLRAKFPNVEFTITN
jgi:hypothetical protein